MVNSNKGMVWYKILLILILLNCIGSGLLIVQLTVGDMRNNPLNDRILYGINYAVNLALLVNLFQKMYRRSKKAIKAIQILFIYKCVISLLYIFACMYLWDFSTLQYGLSPAFYALAILLPSYFYLRARLDNESDNQIGGKK